MMEENAQMSLLPDAVGATQMTMTGEEEIDLSEYEIVRPEFFAHIKEPALTVNVDKIGVNTACVRLMPDVEYVQILVNRKEKKLLLKPCDEIEITGYRWGKTKEGKRYPTQRTGELFVLTICELMDWNPDYRYKVLGRMVQANGKALIAFDLTSSECFPKVVNRDGKKVSSRQSIFAEQWSGKFGPTYSESRRSLAVKTFDNYTVITVNGKKTEVHTAPLKYESTEVFLPMINQSTVDKSTEQWLDSIEEQLYYDRWYCGHYHTAKKIEKIQFMYNDFDEFPENKDGEIDDEDELCYECSLYDDNSYLDENGEWVNCCLDCPLNRMNDN